MPNTPPGGGQNDEDDPEQPSQNPLAGTPFEQLFGGFASGDLGGLQAVFGQLQRMFTPHTGAVNWEFSRDLARSAVAQAADPSPTAGDRARVQDVARVAEQWLDRATEVPSPSATIAVWSRAEWVEASMPVWQRLVEPVAESLVAAMGKALPSEAQQLAGPMLGMLNQIGSSIFSAQLGQAVGALATEVVSATDLGIPVGEAGMPAIVTLNANQFAAGLDGGESDVLLYLVLRECAHQRLYAHAPWLREYLFAAIEDYCRGITIDTSNIEQTLHSLDVTQLESVQDALTGGMFDLEPTPAQQAALSRLETALALIEGWVDEVVGQAADAVMPAAPALREAVRRRRAAGGPAEATFAALVGLELRPRRLRDASALWGALRASEGPAARDAVWAHQDLLPTAADLDDPMAFAARTKEADELDIESAEFDAALTALLTTGDIGSHDDPDAGDTAAQDTGETGNNEHRDVGDETVQHTGEAGSDEEPDARAATSDSDDSKGDDRPSEPGSGPSEPGSG
jgi:putative hydrolase